MMTLKDIIDHNSQLPASQIAVSVNQALAEHQNVVITAPPGAGKSTLLPLTILEGKKGKGKIIMLEPRRMATRQIAERMASMLGEKTGKTIGFRIRFESRVSEDTQIEVVTEAILTRMLVNDATLDGVDTVIFDEFHERSLNSDLALALTRQTQLLIRPDLRIVIMSATIDADSISHTLQAPIIHSEGRMFPVKVFHAEENLDRFHLAQTVASAVLKLHRQYEGDILVFLPGQGEIRKCEELLKAAYERTDSSPSEDACPTRIFPLYGNLPQEEQLAAIIPSAGKYRKIVLATPIAETSLTIEGVRIVFDSGYYRKLVSDTHTGLSHLETERITLDMANQRAGRAGRISDGICYRLWTLATEHQMKSQRTPEIEEADLTSLLLEVAAFGETDIIALPWLTLPPKGQVLQAQQLLQMLGALAPTTDGKSEISITPLGKKMANIPCHPRISKMILSASSKEQIALACDISALLEEKDPLVDSNDCDLSYRISILRDRRHKKALGKWSRIEQIAQEYRKICHTFEDNSEINAEEIGMLLAFAYPERIAKSTDNIGNFRLANGKRIKIDIADAMSSHEWICIASMNTFDDREGSGKVFLAAPIGEEALKRISRIQKRISWDAQVGAVIMREEERIGQLVLSSSPIHDAPKEDVIDVICKAIMKDGLSMLDWNIDVQRLQLRIAQVGKWHPELEIPDVSTIHLLNTVQDWLPFYLEENGHVKSSIVELRKLNLREIVWNMIPYDIQQHIDHLAPTHVQVPSGSKIRIDYRQGAAAPVLSVRLQECFGMAHTPCVNDGKQPLLMELLSPGFKPVQLTQDLQSFWQGTYFEVRKELKRRYPKHEWPENPMESKAVKGVRKTGTRF